MNFIFLLIFFPSNYQMNRDIDITQFFSPLTDYEIGQCIGSGTSAKVYIAKKKPKNELVALKILKSNFQDPMMKTQFVREVEAMAYIQHPAIIALKGYSVPQDDGNADETPTIATEYMENGTLLDVLIKEKNGGKIQGWTPTQKSIVIFGIASGMMCIHNCNAIHRDLKPANILLNSKFEPKIADFGLSKIENSESMQSIVGGTPLWMAPELFLEKQYTNKVDVFAFGMILYQIITGRLPFDGKLNPYQISNNILNGGRPEINGDVQDFYRQLIQDCWKQNPDERPTFDDIVFRLANTNTIISGTDLNIYQNYKNKILKVLKPHPSQEVLNKLDSFNEYNSKQINKEESKSNQTNSHRRKQLKSKAKKGDIDAMYKYGVKLIKKGKDEEAASYIVTAALRGHMDSQMLAAKFYETGRGVEVNATQAAFFYKNAADAGNKEAQYKCGEILESGKGVKQNIEKAIYYYNKASEQNHIGAILALGHIYSHNNNLQESLFYYDKAAQLNDLQGLLLAGEIAEKICPEKALQYYENAVKLGNINAIYECGRIFEYGIGQQKNIQHAKAFYETAAKNGHQKSIAKLSQLSEYNNYNDLTILKTKADSGDIESCYKVGVYLMEKHEPSSSDYIYAANYLIKVNTPDAQYRCGVLLEKGLGVKADLQKAAYFYKLAADKGHLDALYHLSSMLFNGSGIKKDTQQANRYLKIAADKGHLLSQLTFAYNAYNGIGMTQNYSLAASYYKLAAEQNSPQGLCTYGIMAQSGKGMPQDSVLAVKCFRKAAFLGDPVGQYNYALMLQTGNGIEKNIYEASKYYKLAADNDNVEAQCNYAILISQDHPELPKNIVEARHYAKLASDGGSPTGQFLYAQILNKIDNNITESIKYYRLSAAQGNVQAQRMLTELGVNQF